MSPPILFEDNDLSPHNEPLTTSLRHRILAMHNTTYNYYCNAHFPDPLSMPSDMKGGQGWEEVKPGIWQCHQTQPTKSDDFEKIFKGFYTKCNGNRSGYKPWRSATKGQRAEYMADIRARNGEAEATRVAAEVTRVAQEKRSEDHVWIRGRNEEEEAARAAEDKRDEKTECSSTATPSSYAGTPAASTCSSRRTSSPPSRRSSSEVFIEWMTGTASDCLMWTITTASDCTRWTIGIASDCLRWKLWHPSTLADWENILITYAFVQLALLDIIVLRYYDSCLRAFVVWLASGSVAVLACMTCEACRSRRPGSLVLAFQMTALIVVWFLGWAQTQIQQNSPALESRLNELLESMTDRKTMGLF